MQLPPQNSLSVNILATVFDSTTATYKYFWFLAILDAVAKGAQRISFKELFLSMVINAWYPVNYFKLSFGACDKLSEAVLKLQKDFDIDISLSSTALKEKLLEKDQNNELKKYVSFLAKYVPYCFLNPWLKSTDNKVIIAKSKNYTNNCLYSIDLTNKDFFITINDNWLSYLQKHYLILKDFTYWCLVVFLQKRNPNVPNIAGKLVKDGSRHNLTTQRSFWNFLFNHGFMLDCIYTKKVVDKNHFALDHFIPWSFVSHDLMWNLIPVDVVSNSSKSDNLPNMKEHLKPFADAQHHALQAFFYYSKKTKQIRGMDKLLDDYVSLGTTAQSLAIMSDKECYSYFKKTFKPMHQIALNMGFTPWTQQ